jgi:hypothetical protein
MDRLDKIALRILLALCLLGAAGDHIVGGWQVYSRVAWDDIRFPAASIPLGVANPPSRVQFRDDGSGSPGVFVLEFSDEIEANEEQVWGDAQMPHPWVLESDTDAHIHWSLEDDTDCNARFCAEHLTSKIGGDWPATTTTICGDCASGADADNHNICDLGDIDMTGMDGVSAMIKFRLYRNSSHANDTCNSKDALLHEFDLHYQSDTRGSRSETAK